MSDYYREKRILLLGMGIIFGFVFSYMMIYGFTHRSQPIVNGDPSERIIEVPSSYGKLIMLAASNGYSSRHALVTILFERGIMTLYMDEDQSYRIVYLDQEAP